MKQANTTYLDITQLVHWPGRLTGIPRVLNELTLRYADEPHTRFIVWDNKDRCFYEVDVKQSLEGRGKGIFYRANESNSPADGALPVSPRRARSTLKRLSSPIKNRMPQAYERLSTKFGASVTFGQAKGPVIRPQASETLFVLWGEWADSNYRSHLVSLNESGVALANIVYDMLPVLTPQYSGHSTKAMDDFYQEVIPLCKIVFSISESTKRDLTAWLKVRNLTVPTIKVFRLGDDFAISKPRALSDSRVNESIAKRGFILCVGTIEARKNHTLLYYAYKLAKSRGITLPLLVIVGRRGYESENIYNLITLDPETKDLMLPMTDVSDEELSWLYRNCLFTVYPSFYEGWGLPIAESIAYGKVCLASDTSSMPEVAGELAVYFNPASSDECLGAIQSMLDEHDRQPVEQRLKNYKLTKWDDTFHQVKNGFKEVSKA